MRKGIPALLLTLSLLLCGCRLLPERIPPAGLTVHFLDVGQADCALLESGGEYMLIDGGNREDGRLVVSYLEQQGVEELAHMQKTTEAICDWLEAHPESLPKARRFAEYYIPTTLKLLHTYNDVQGQQGENAEAIRRDIAGILHTLNQAYDNLYDKLLSDVALDVSSEIAALQGMLANDGLTGEGML